jgi:predicted GNAT family acetyltransferase
MSDEVTNNAEGNRYEVEVDGVVAELTYRRDGDRIELLHTGVPDALEGRGIGSTIVRGAIEDAARQGLTVVPRCTFVQSWLERHPDEAATVTLEPVS